MDLLTSEYLKKLQNLQYKYGEYLNSFSITVAWDSYYETYLRCVYTDNNGRYMADFMQCIYQEDFERVYTQLCRDLYNITQDEQE